tara:strand:+ start:884 stop:1078 length:195 start_codon:yes stop_codon:yes gene_type:complete
MRKNIIGYKKSNNFITGYYEKQLVIIIIVYIIIDPLVPLFEKHRHKTYPMTMTTRLLKNLSLVF